MAQGTTKGVPIDTDPLLAADSDLLVPSQKAVKSYAQPQLNGTGFVKSTGTTISYDNSTYLTSVGTGVTNELTYWSGTNTIGSLSTSTYPSLTELSYVKGVTSAIQTQLNAKQATLTNPVTGTGTNNEIAYFNTTGSTIGSLTTATYPSLTELSYVKGLTSSAQTQISGRGYTLMAGAIASNTTSGANMYIGMASRVVSGTAAVSRVYIPQSGTVKRIDLVSSSATAGTAESWTMNFRLNNNTNTTIATVASATTTRVWSNSSLSIVVAAGDYFEITALNPTWTTNPGATSYYATVYIQ